MVLAKITIKHAHARVVRGVAAYRGSVCAMYIVRVFPRYCLTSLMKFGKQFRST